MLINYISLETLKKEVIYCPPYEKIGFKIFVALAFVSTQNYYKLVSLYKLFI